VRGISVVSLIVA